MSYRRQDSAAYAGRIFDRLAAEFGTGAVFGVEDSIAPGENIADVIKQHLAAANAVIVLIGPGWLNQTYSDGRRRIDDPTDFVAMEIALALEQSAGDRRLARPPGVISARVIPVLVGGASMPPIEALPSTLRPLAYRNALIVTDTGFHQDMDRLISAIARPTADAAGAQAAPASSARPATVDDSVPRTNDRSPKKTEGRRRRWLATVGIPLALGSGLWLWTRSPTVAPIPSVPGLAEFARGERYFFGRGTIQDFAEAANWYRRSAELGNPSAQNAIGRLYEERRGVPKNLNEAKIWYERAARQGQPDAIAALLRLEKTQ